MAGLAEKNRRFSSLPVNVGNVSFNIVYLLVHLFLFTHKPYKALCGAYYYTINFINHLNLQRAIETEEL